MPNSSTTSHRTISPYSRLRSIAFLIVPLSIVSIPLVSVSYPQTAVAVSPLPARQWGGLNGDKRAMRLVPLPKLNFDIPADVKVICLTVASVMVAGHHCGSQF
jgi:hypothetical protein